MPFKSLAQEHYMEAHKKELEKLWLNISEWEQATKGKDLPEKVKPKK